MLFFFATDTLSTIETEKCALIKFKVIYSIPLKRLERMVYLNKSWP